MRNPDRILLVRLSHLGDVVHALGVFHALHAAYPGAEIAWAVQPEFAGLLAGLPGLARMIPFKRRGGPAAWLRVHRELRDFRPDWTVDAQGNAKSGAIAWLSRAPRRVASARADWQEPWAAWTATEQAPALVRPARHAMQRMEALATHLVPALRLPLRLDVVLTPEEARRGEEALVERARPAAGHVLLHLSSPGDVRAWPAQRWAELVRALRAEGRGVLVLSGPAEAELGAALAHDFAADPGVAHWIAQRGLRELAALFAAAAARELVLVACDSGPMHLAAAQGLAVVALEGPQEAARTGPWPIEPRPSDAAGSPAREARVPRHRIVRAARQPDCAPCFARRCRHPQGPICMREIAAEDVLAALARRQ